MSAQQPDPIAIAPTIYKVLFENDQVRMLEVTMMPGDASAMHYHPDSIVYVVAGGKARMSAPDGSNMDMEVKAGEPFWQPAGSHAVENTGGAEIKAIMVELNR
jgi:quercetin dioxygenase-like cupin family protein